MDFIQNNQKNSCITALKEVLYTHGQTTRSATDTLTESRINRKEINMEIIKTGSYHLEKLSGNTYKVYHHQYAIGTLTEYGEVELSDEIINGYAKKPHSGYWISEIEKIIKNR